MDETNRDNSSTGFRRAFPLSSRAVWVEQSHVQLTDDVFLLPKDNLEIGPGRYRPQKVDRHVKTPMLGTSSAVLSLPTHYDFGSHGFQPSASLNSYSITEDLPFSNNKSRSEKSEFSTIFHDQDRRQPIDSKRRYCSTPGPYMGQSNPLEFITIDGKRHAQKAHFGDSKRFEKVTSKLTYNVQYDSNHLRPRITQGFTPLQARTSFFLGPSGSMSSSRHSLSFDREIGNSSSRSETSIPFSNLKREKHPLEERTRQPNIKEEAPVALPVDPNKPTRSKQERLPEIKFDSSCYSDVKKELPIDLYPQKINKLVKSNIFGRIVKLPKYKAPDW